MRTTIETRFNPVGDAVMNASRQMWLASISPRATWRMRWVMAWA